MEIVNFTHQNVSVKAGTTVVWTNRDPTPHTVIAGSPLGGPPGPWGSGLLAPGQSFSVTFARAGVYPYYCRIHPSRMQATVLVSG